MWTTRGTVLRARTNVSVKWMLLLAVLRGGTFIQRVGVMAEWLVDAMNGFKKLKPQGNVLDCITYGHREHIFSLSATAILLNSLSVAGQWMISALSCYCARETQRVTNWACCSMEWHWSISKDLQSPYPDIVQSWYVDNAPAMHGKISSFFIMDRLVECGPKEC